MKKIFFIVAMCSLSTLPAMADIIRLDSGTGIGFQDEGTTTQDHTALLLDQDGIWSPTSAGTVVYDYYATGTSGAYWDAISLEFDLSTVGYQNIQSASLWFYTRKGGYANQSSNGYLWHDYQVLPGPFNPANEDISPIAAGGLTSFSSDAAAPYTDEQWLSAAIPLADFQSDDFSVTLRLWNAQIDTVELRVNVVPVPGAFLLGMLGLGVAGARLRRRRA